jgi:hypothetical protein
MRRRTGRAGRCWAAQGAAQRPACLPCGGDRGYAVLRPPPELVPCRLGLGTGGRQAGVQSPPQHVPPHLALAPAATSNGAPPQGPTGCGKTSLVNALAGRLPVGGTLQGSVLVNNMPRGKGFRSLTAYVLQDGESPAGRAGFCPGARPPPPPHTHLLHTTMLRTAMLPTHGLARTSPHSLLHPACSSLTAPHSQLFTPCSALTAPHYPFNPTATRSPSSPFPLHSALPPADVLFSMLTVRETFDFAARVRLPESVTRATKDALVTAIITELGLGKAQHTFIGDYCGVGEVGVGCVCARGEGKEVQRAGGRVGGWRVRLVLLTLWGRRVECELWIRSGGPGLSAALPPLEQPCCRRPAPRRRPDHP